MLDTTKESIAVKLTNMAGITALAQSSLDREEEGSLQKRLEIVVREAKEALAQLAMMQERRCRKAEANRRGNGEACSRGHNWVMKPHNQDEAYHLS